MSPQVTQRPRARLDLLEQFVYFGEQAGLELGERYFAAVSDTCRRLIKHRRIGMLYDSGIEGLEGLRRHPVRIPDHLQTIHGQLSEIEGFLTG